MSEVAQTTPAIACLAADLFFATRLEDVIRALGGRPILADSPEAFVQAMDRDDPVLGIVDLGAPGNWEDAIRRCKVRPHTAQTPIIAFGSHVDTATLKRARNAGADHAWARSKMMDELPDVIERALRPPIIYPAGWDEPLSALARAGIEEFNRGAYFEQHELLEAAWRAEERPIREMYQGILQIGIAFLQIERLNWAGAVKMFRRGLPRLRTLPAVCQGIDIAGLRDAAERLHAQLVSLGPERMAEFAVETFPTIEFAHGAVQDQPTSRL